MSKQYTVKWTDNKGNYHEKYYNDESASKRVYSRKRNEKVLRTIYCERVYTLVGDEYDGTDTEYPIEKFVRRTFMGIALPEFEVLEE